MEHADGQTDKRSVHVSHARNAQCLYWGLMVEIPTWGHWSWMSLFRVIICKKYSQFIHKIREPISDTSGAKHGVPYAMTMRYLRMKTFTINRGSSLHVQYFKKDSILLLQLLFVEDYCLLRYEPCSMAYAGHVYIQNTYQITWPNTPNYSNLHSHRRDNFKSHFLSFIRNNPSRCYSRLWNLEYIYILWRAAWKPERRSGLAEHVSPATFGSVDKNRIAPVFIQRKPLYNNRGNAIAIQRMCWNRFRHNVTLTWHVLNTVG
jgi:hypothetical protein